MIETFRKKVTIQRLEKDCGNIDVAKGSSYYTSYPEFLRFFNDLNADKAEAHHLIVAANFTYGWMPTTLKFRSDQVSDVLMVLRSAMEGRKLGLSQLEKVKKFLNNSVVGTSKLLHFANPNKFPIWDSRVYRYLTATEPHHYRLDSCAVYLGYMEFCHQLTSDPLYSPIHKAVEETVGYAMSKARTAELIMYANGAKENRPKVK